MKKIKLLLVIIIGTFFTISAQIDTLAIYNLTDGGGDPVIKAPVIKVVDLGFSDYTRVGVIPSSGSGFFVSKGFPFGDADYDTSLYHTFVVTPENGSTLYIKKFSMNHKRSGNNPNPGNIVNFKCEVSFNDTVYVFGTGTTINSTAWFYADNLKIISSGPVTFKLYAKDLFDDSQSWMQRWVSLIGAVAPEGTDIEDITGPLEPTYLEVARDYINPLTFYKLNAVGELAAPLINDMSGLPLNYTFIVSNEVDLTNVSFDFILPAGTTIESAMPTDFSTVSKQSVVLNSSWGTRKAYITVKKIKPAPNDVDIKFDITNNTNSWTDATEGWIANGISETVSSNARFASEKSALVVAWANVMNQLSFDISTETSGFTGMFTVESSGDAITWDFVAHFNGCNNISSSATRLVTWLPENARYARFVYNCRNGSQTVNINNIQTISFPASLANTQQAEELFFYPNPAHSQIAISEANSLKELSFYSISGVLVKRITKVSSVLNVDDLKPGMYLIKSVFSTGAGSVSQIIIQ